MSGLVAVTFTILAFIGACVIVAGSLAVLVKLLVGKPIDQAFDRFADGDHPHLPSEMCIHDSQENAR